MNEAEIKERSAQAKRLADVVGGYFEKENAEVGLVMSVLMSMLVGVMRDNMPPHEAIALFATGMCKACEVDDEEDEPKKEGVAKWLN